MRNVSNNATAVNPSMRTGVMSFTCSVVWNQAERQPEEQFAKQMSEHILRFVFRWLLLYYICCVRAFL